MWAYGLLDRGGADKQQGLKAAGSGRRRNKRGSVGQYGRDREKGWQESRIKGCRGVVGVADRSVILSL